MSIRRQPSSAPPADYDDTRSDTMSERGLITVKSNHSAKETIDRVEASLQAKGITVFARIDHAAGAASVGLPLRATELIIFGSPKSGTPLMQSMQSIGIDLPLKMLGWQDETGAVWLSYNDMRWLGQRHGLGAEAFSAGDALARILASLAEAAAA
jgi:uncharacterized protein (DUF302 family)